MEPAAFTPRQSSLRLLGSCVRVREPAAFTPHQTVDTLSLCTRDTIPRCSTPRGSSGIAIGSGQPRVLHLHRNTRHRRHQQVAAPECFSPSQLSSFNRRLSSAKLSTVAQAVVSASAVVLVIFSQRPRSSCSPMDTSSLFARPVPGLLILYKSTQYFGMCRIEITN